MKPCRNPAVTKLPIIPKEIGPHEGHELELMRAGSKPLAMFYGIMGYEDWVFPETEFQPFVDSGQFICKEYIFTARKPRPLKVRYLFYAQAKEAWRIERLAEISKAFNETSKKTTDALETETGQLLGYSDHEIAVYLKHCNRMKPFKKALSIQF